MNGYGQLGGELVTLLQEQISILKTTSSLNASLSKLLAQKSLPDNWNSLGVENQPHFEFNSIIEEKAEMIRSELKKLRNEQIIVMKRMDSLRASLEAQIAPNAFRSANNRTFIPTSELIEAILYASEQFLEDFYAHDTTSFSEDKYLPLVAKFKELLVYSNYERVEVSTYLAACNHNCKRHQAYSANETLLLLPEFYPIAADFDPCCWKLIVELPGDKPTKSEIAETCKYLASFPFSRLLDRLNKRKRHSNQLNHNRLLLNTLLDFHHFCNQQVEIEAIRTSALFKETSEALLATLEDSEFSFTSIESDELIPEGPDAWNITIYNNIIENDSFFNDDFSSDLDFISQ